LDLILGERDVSKYYIRVAMELLYDIIPARVLLYSSASAL